MYPGEERIRLSLAAAELSGYLAEFSGFASFPSEEWAFPVLAGL